MLSAPKLFTTLNIFRREPNIATIPRQSPTCGLSGSCLIYEFERLHLRSTSIWLIVTCEFQQYGVILWTFHFCHNEVITWKWHIFKSCFFKVHLLFFPYGNHSRLLKIDAQIIHIYQSVDDMFLNDKSRQFILTRQLKFTWAKGVQG